ncbi:MAG: hypothetical protein IT223_12640 [Crocinitomicaceae bacterium]|nr:hypothetical protein [Crocinitomicaceae bacterium]
MKSLFSMIYHKGRIIALTLFAIVCAQYSWAQCQSYIQIDGQIVNASEIAANGLHLPLWLKEGQTLAADQMVNSISVIEFDVNGSTLEFSQVLKVTSVQTVPSGKVWKVESLVKTTSSLTAANSAVYSNGGTYTFNVPTCTSYICIEAWGGGGGGYAGTAGGGGGGGAYGQSCFTVTPGQSLSVTVGSGGTFGTPGVNGGTTSITGTGVNISASGGSGSSSSTGGAGGTSVTGTIIVYGGKGANGLSLSNPYYGGAGGAAGGSQINPGGEGSSGSSYASNIASSSTPGGFPGGGGGGQACCGGNSSKGAEGKVIISW